MEKILVCITPQSNSQRLIDRAVVEADLLEGELHILNIQKGDNIFFNENSAELLEELFNYGSKKGGTVHALAGEDITGLILKFVKKQKITKIVLGEPPKSGFTMQNAGIIDNLERKLKGIEIIIVERETCD